MIFVVAGTQDGRELVVFLLAHGYAVTASVVSRYGEQLLAKYKEQGLIVNDQPLDEDALRAYLKAHAIRALVDASHPYAENVSANAMAACHALHVPYIRYERQRTPIAYKNIHRVANYEEAAKKAAELGKRIFLTTGSRNLKAFAQSPYLADAVLTARVLPSAEIIAECLALGFTPKNIIAMQGPFSQALNEELFKKYDAEAIVTKNSGQIGGTDTKFAAAEALGLPIVLIDRPTLSYDHLAQDFAEVLRFLC